jgi:predicted alpha/beta-fold hydrolase
MHLILFHQPPVMPIIPKSDFKSPFWLISEHWETITPALARKPKKLNYTRERITTRDDDFLDLDFVYNDKSKIVILSHGLEGHSDKYYMRGMAQYFHSKGWDSLSWNCRSCSEEMNLKPKLYHHGATEDLEDVINYVITKRYQEIALIGFSLGGSLVVKYLGENGKNIPNEIAGGVAISIPSQLGSCAKQLSTPSNKFYLKRFMKKLKNKIRQKAAQFPGMFDIKHLDSISNFFEFDTRFTAPMYGFKSAEDFYTYASAGNYIEGIQTPTLLVSSLNDPMFPDDCYPFDAAKNHHYFHLETPRTGGHMGYWWPGRKVSWIEQRAYQFISDIV